MSATLALSVSLISIALLVVVLAMWLLDQFAVDDPRPQWHQQLDEELDEVRS